MIEDFGLAFFRLAQYRFTLRALEPIHLPPYRGSTLRGGLGHALKRLTCFQSQLCGDRCELGNACPYGYIFETAPPEDTEVLSKARSVARPFVIRPSLDRRAVIEVGEELVFDLILIGRGIEYCPYFILAFKELGELGLGRGRGKYRLQSVEAVTFGTRETRAVYRATDDMIRPVDCAISGEEIIARAEVWSPSRLAITFLTPTRLKYRKRWMRDGPPFHVLIRRLLDRISSLAYFHCGELWDIDFRGTIDRAREDVRLADSGAGWGDWRRYSGRQEQRIRMGGLVGRATYAGDLGPYRALLSIGEQVHVGKGTVFGNGWFEIGS